MTTLGLGGNSPSPGFLKFKSGGPGGKFFPNIFKLGAIGFPNKFGALGVALSKFGAFGANKFGAIIGGFLFNRFGATGVGLLNKDGAIGGSFLGSSFFISTFFNDSFSLFPFFINYLSFN